MPDFVGREKELNDFDIFLTAKEKGVFVVIGEIGIGKTALMKELSNRVKQNEDVIIGFYKLPGVVATHTPFVDVLADLLSTIEERDKSEGITTFRHIGDAIEEVFKRRKSEFIKSLLRDVSKNLKVGETFNFLDGIWKETKKIPAIELAEETIAQHKQEFTDFYLDLLGALARKTNKKAVFMIDQFERATKSSIDFFMSVVRGLPKGIYMVASFKIGEEAKHYEEIEPDLRYESSKIEELKGLSEDEIGEWIRGERGVELLKPELKKIRKESGGFPVILNEWISQSKKLNLDELKGEMKRALFKFYEKRMNKLDDKTQIFARRLSVLLQPLTLESYARLVKEDGFTKKECDNCIRRLIQAQIFSADAERWFKHELVQEYVQDENMGDELSKSYHENAAIFFEELYKNAVESGEKVDFVIALGCAYHFHHAGLPEKSYSHNYSLAKFSFDIGSLDVAEACYGRAIEDAKKLGDEKGIATQRGNLARIYRIWGRVDDALNTLQELYDYFKENGDKGNEATALHHIGNIHYRKGEYEKALEKYKKSLEINEEIGDKSGIATTLHEIGIVHQAKGDYEKALDKYTKSFKIEEKIGDKQGIALSLGQIGRIKHRQKRYHEAILALTTAASLFKELVSPYFETAKKDLASIKEEIGEDKFKEIMQELEK